MIFDKLVKNLTEQRRRSLQEELYRNLIRHEAKIGGQLFGPVEHGRRREFFCLDEHTWVWYEEWIDGKGQHRVMTTRYEIRPDGVLKSQNGYYQSVSRPEALRLLEAMELYQQRVVKHMYGSALAV